MLLGRGMYEEWAAYWPTSDIEPFATFINGVPEVRGRLARTGRRLGTSHGGHRRSGRASSPSLKQTDGASIGMHGSITLAQSLLRAGLVDELRLVIAPATAGSGQRLFERDELRRWDAARLAKVSPSGELVLHYRRRTD